MHLVPYVFLTLQGEIVVCFEISVSVRFQLSARCW